MLILLLQFCRMKAALGKRCLVEEAEARGCAESPSSGDSSQFGLAAVAGAASGVVVGDDALRLLRDVSHKGRNFRKKLSRIKRPTQLCKLSSQSSG